MIRTVAVHDTVEVDIWRRGWMALAMAG
jgi:hypothetical protein